MTTQEVQYILGFEEAKDLASYVAKVEAEAASKAEEVERLRQIVDEDKGQNGVNDLRDAISARKSALFNDDDTIADLKAQLKDANKAHAKSASEARANLRDAKRAQRQLQDAADEATRRMVSGLAAGAK